MSQDWDRRYAESELVWSAEPNRFLVAEVGGLPAGRALDLGCGEGRNSVWLAERDWQVTGVDFSQVGLDKARRLAAGRGVEVSWVHTDLTDYQPAEGAFDLVIVLYIHLPPAQRRQVLKRAEAALAPGGTLLVVGHDRLNLTEGHGGPQNPEVLFTAADIERELPGLLIERSGRLLRPITVDGRGVTAIDAHVRAKRPDYARNSTA